MAVPGEEMFWQVAEVQTLSEALAVDDSHELAAAALPDMDAPELNAPDLNAVEREGGAEAAPTAPPSSTSTGGG